LNKLKLAVLTTLLQYFYRFITQVKHFEPIWGDKGKNKGHRVEASATATSSSATDSLLPPKPSAYNLRRSPNRSPFAEKSQSLESSAVSNTVINPTCEKDSPSQHESIAPSPKFILDEVDITDDEEDDENDADFEVDEESSSEMEEVEEEMSSARTTGLVQRSNASSFTNSNGSPQSRKRLGVAEESDQDTVLKKCKISPPTVSSSPVASSSQAVKGTHSLGLIEMLGSYVRYGKCAV
jgi:hypothetical protein